MTEGYRHLLRVFWAAHNGLCPRCGGEVERLFNLVPAVAGHPDCEDLVCTDMACGFRISAKEQKRLRAMVAQEGIFDTSLEVFDDWVKDQK